MLRALLVTLSLVFPAFVSVPRAQSLQEFVVTSSSTVLAVSQPIPGVGGVCDPAFTRTCVGPGSGVTLGGLSTALGINNLTARIDESVALISAAQNQLSLVNAQIASMQSQLVSINSSIANMNADISRSLEIGAIAASMRDAVPNAGDRFAIRLNAAAIDGYVGGSIGVSVNLSDNVRLSANYGRGSTQNVVSGGLNFSFR